MADEQVGNSSYLTMTPGSAVAGQLQNILTQKRLDAHQALMDSIAQQNAGLNERNINSQIQDRDRQAATNEEYRQGLISNRKTQELQRLTSVLSPHMPFNDTEGADYKLLQQNAPSLIDPGTPGTDPLAPGVEGPTRPSTGPSFHGTPAQLKTEHQEKLQADLQQMMSDPTKWDPLPDAQKEALYRGAYNASIQENVLHPKVGGKVFFADEDTKQLIDAATSQRVTANSVGPNDKIVNIPHKPIGPAAPAPTYYDLEDEAGNKSVYGVGRDNKATPIQFPSGLRVLGQSGKDRPAPMPKEPAQQTRTNFAEAKRAWLKTPKDATRESMLKHWASQFVNEYTGIDPSVKEQILQYYNEPGYRNTPIDEFKTWIDDDNLKTKNGQDAVKLWQQLVQ